MTIRQLCSEYIQVIGSPIPYSDFGYMSVESLVQDWKDIFKPIWYNEESMITYSDYCINSQSQIVIDLIKGQKQNNKSFYQNNMNVSELKQDFITRDIQDEFFEIISKHLYQEKLKNKFIPLNDYCQKNNVDVISYPELVYLLKKNFPNQEKLINFEKYYYLKYIPEKSILLQDCQYYKTLEKRYEESYNGHVCFFIVNLHDDLLLKLENLFKLHKCFELYDLNTIFKQEFGDDISYHLYGFNSILDIFNYYSFKFYLKNNICYCYDQMIIKNLTSRHIFPLFSNFCAKLVCFHNVNLFWLQMIPNQLGIIQHLIRRLHYCNDMKLINFNCNIDSKFTENDNSLNQFLIALIKSKFYRVILLKSDFVLNSKNTKILFVKVLCFYLILQK